jgi:hypothetical protein
LGVTEAGGHRSRHGEQMQRKRKSKRRSKNRV